MYIATLFCTIEVTVNDKLKDVVQIDASTVEEIPYRHLFGATIEELKEKLESYLRVYPHTIMADPAVSMMIKTGGAMIAESLREDLAELPPFQAVAKETGKTPSEVLYLYEHSVGSIVKAVKPMDGAHVRFYHEGVFGTPHSNILVQYFGQLMPLLDEALIEELQEISDDYLNGNKMLEGKSGLN